MDLREAKAGTRIFGFSDGCQDLGLEAAALADSAIQRGLAGLLARPTSDDMSLVEVVFEGPSRDQSDLATASILPLTEVRQRRGLSWEPIAGATHYLVQTVDGEEHLVRMPRWTGPQAAVAIRAIDGRVSKSLYVPLAPNSEAVVAQTIADRTATIGSEIAVFDGLVAASASKAWARNRPVADLRILIAGLALLLVGIMIGWLANQVLGFDSRAQAPLEAVSPGLAVPTPSSNAAAPLAPTSIPISGTDSATAAPILPPPGQPASPTASPP